GAGKSTLAKLMARMYDPMSGTVSYGGVDLRRASFASLRERIVVVPQEGHLFQGTVLDNVRIGRPGATDEDVRAAMASIGALEHVEELHQLGAGEQLPLEGEGEPGLDEGGRRRVADLAPQVEEPVLDRGCADHGLPRGMGPEIFDQLAGTAHDVKSPSFRVC